LYRVDRLKGGAQGEGGGGDGHGRGDDAIRVSPEAMKRMQVYVQDFTEKTRACKTHLKETLALLNEMAFDSIERVLLGSQHAQQGKAEEATGGVAVFECPACSRTFRSARGLVQHAASCKRGA